LNVKSPVKISALTEIMCKDKKRFGDSIDFILLERIGKAMIFTIKVKDLEGLMNDLS